MSKKAKQPFSSVLSVNPYKGTYLSGIASFLKNVKSPEYSKQQFVISFLNTKGFINAIIEVSKNIPDEDLFDAISNKIYDELALDQAIEYQIHYIENFGYTDDENRSFHVFIVDPLTLKETFLNVTEKIKYIDVIIPAPLLIKSLYAKDIIETGGVHCFVYIQENDASLTVYKDREFIYTKSLNFSIIDMHEKFCELYGERINYDEFLSFIKKENLKETDSEYKPYLLKLYQELFSNINEVLTYIKRAFEVEKIDHLYIGSQLNLASKIYEMAEFELNLRTSDFAFDYGFENEAQHIDEFHSLMHTYISLNNEEKYDCNFTIFHRPPKFIQRESGKLFMVIAVSLLIAFAYPITYWVLTYAQSLQLELLKEKNIKIKIEAKARKSLVDSKQNEKKRVLSLLNEEKKDYQDKKNTLIKIHQVKVDYPMKAKLLTTLTSSLNRFGVHLKTISYDEEKESKSFTFGLVANKDKKITQLVEYLTKKYIGRFKFSLEEINFNEDSKQYVSELKVKIL